MDRVVPRGPNVAEIARGQVLQLRALTRTAEGSLDLPAIIPCCGPCQLCRRYPSVADRFVPVMNDASELFKLRILGPCVLATIIGYMTTALRIAA